MPDSRPRQSEIIELRRYRLQAGARETLIELFDRELVESQEAAGMRVIGQFRDLDDPDVFVWLRGFSDMQARSQSLRSFYGGPVWAAHREAANATMLNSDNVLLLRPAAPDAGFAPPRETRAAPQPVAELPGLVVATVSHLAPDTAESFARFFAEQLRPALERTGADVRAALVSEHGPNGFPQLPVRDGETVFAWFSAFPGPAAYESHRSALAKDAAWRDAFHELERRTFCANEVSRLTPTGRSLLH